MRFDNCSIRKAKGFSEANEQKVEAGGVGVNSQSRGNPTFSRGYHGPRKGNAQRIIQGDVVQ